MATVDTRLPLLAAQGAHVDLAGLFRQQQEHQARQQQIQMQQERMQWDREDRGDRQTLRSLLPDAIEGNPEALRGVAGVDPGTYMQIKSHLSSMDEAAREREGQKWEAAGPLLAQMRNMPYEQRRAFLQQAAPLLQAKGWTPEELMRFDPTDEAVNSLGTAAMTISQVLDSQKITWHQVGERGSFAVDSMGNPTGEGNPFAPGSSNAPPPPPGFELDGGPASAPGTFRP